MKKKKFDIYKFLLKPPLWLDIAVWLMTLAAIGGSVFLLCTDERAHLAAFSLYAVALALTILSLYLLMTFGDFPQRIASNPYVRRFVADYGFRTYVAAVCSAAFNSIYVTFGTLVAIQSNSAWLGALVWYNLLLAISRGLIVIYVRRNADGERGGVCRLQAYVFTGISLIFISLAMIPVVFLVVHGRNSYSFFGGTLVYVTALALYTVIKCVASIVNRRKATKSGNPALSAMRSVGMASALISVFALQATMLVAFNDGELAATLNPIMGSIVAVAIFAMGVTMIIRGANRMKRGEVYVAPPKADEFFEIDEEEEGEDNR